MGGVISAVAAVCQIVATVMSVVKMVNEKKGKQLEEKFEPVVEAMQAKNEEEMKESLEDFKGMDISSETKDQMKDKLNIDGEQVSKSLETAVNAIHNFKTNNGVLSNEDKSKLRNANNNIKSEIEKNGEAQDKVRNEMKNLPSALRFNENYASASSSSSFASSRAQPEQQEKNENIHAQSQSENMQTPMFQ